MPTGAYKSATIPEEAWRMAKMLVELGLEPSIGKALTHALKEYIERRKDIIEKMNKVKEEWEAMRPWRATLNVGPPSFSL